MERRDGSRTGPHRRDDVIRIMRGGPGDPGAEPSPQGASAHHRTAAFNARPSRGPREPRPECPASQTQQESDDGADAPSPIQGDSAKGSASMSERRSRAGGGEVRGSDGPMKYRSPTDGAMRHRTSWARAPVRLSTASHSRSITAILAEYRAGFESPNRWAVDTCAALRVRASANFANCA